MRARHWWRLTHQGAARSDCAGAGRWKKPGELENCHHSDSYQVQKARLIEKIAELMQAKKLPFIADILDESAEDIRLVIEPNHGAWMRK